MNLPKKSLGQHWLFDEFSLQAMCDSADVQPGDTVLEIGPGLGTLTTPLVKRAKQVIAVELDDTLAADLPRRVQAANLTVIHQDILAFDFRNLPTNYKVVANVPYYLTSKLIRTLLESSNPPVVTALLVQKEVAQRLAAKPGDLSILGVSAQLYAEVSLDIEVPASLFTPPPKVDSQIVVLKRRQQPLFPDVEPRDFMRVVRAGFSEKRKKINNSLAGGLGLSKEHVAELLTKADVNANLRAEALELDAWYRLTKKWNQK